MIEPIPDEYRQKMYQLAQRIDELLNGPNLLDRKVCFALFIADFDQIEHGRVNFISNGQREDMIAMAKEWIARAEGRYVEPPTRHAH